MKKIDWLLNFYCPDCNNINHIGRASDKKQYYCKFCGLAFQYKINNKIVFFSLFFGLISALSYLLFFFKTSQYNFFIYIILFCLFYISLLILVEKCIYLSSESEPSCNTNIFGKKIEDIIDPKRKSLWTRPFFKN